MPTPSLPPGTKVTIGGIQASVRIDPFEFGIDERGRPWRTVSYLVLGEQGANFCDAAKGIGAYSSVPYGFPQPHRFPHNTNLMCLSVSGRWKGAVQDGPQLLQGDYAEVRVTYGVPEYDIFGEADDVAFGNDAIPWSVGSVRAGLEVFPWPIDDTATMDGIQFVAGSGYEAILPAASSVLYRMPTKDYILKRTNIPNFAAFDDLLTSLMGKVNSGAIWGRAARTLYLDPHDYDVASDPSGRKTGEFTLVFRWRRESWQKEPVPGKFGIFAEIYDADLNRKYQEADFTPLIRWGI